jgi:hypothetical protein
VQNLFGRRLSFLPLSFRSFFFMVVSHQFPDSCFPTFSSPLAIFLVGQEEGSMGVWQGVAMDSLKYHQGPSCPTLLRPASGSLLKRPYSRFRDGLPAGWAACGCLLPLWTPHAVRLWKKVKPVFPRSHPGPFFWCQIRPHLNTEAKPPVSTCQVSHHMVMAISL